MYIMHKIAYKTLVSDFLSQSATVPLSNNLLASHGFKMRRVNKFINIYIPGCCVSLWLNASYNVLILSSMLIVRSIDFNGSSISISVISRDLCFPLQFKKHTASLIQGPELHRLPSKPLHTKELELRRLSVASTGILFYMA
jgi:hypothetical protein